MKKGLLLLGAAALCTSAFAQQEAGWVSADNATVAAAWGWDGSAFSKDKTARDAGTLLMETPNVTLRTSFADDCAVSSINKLKLTYYTVNGVSYKTAGAENNVWNGAVGNTNPSAITDLEAPVINKGWVFDYEVKADGYLTVLCQASLNKNFYVFEGQMGNDGVVSNGAVAYDFIAELAEPVVEAESLGTKVSYTLPADKDGYVDLGAADIDKYVSGGAIMWPIRILMGDAEWTNSVNKYPNTNAVLVFPVYEGCHYYVFATGSKLTGGPFVYTKEKPTQISFTKEVSNEDGTVTTEVFDLVGEDTAVDGIEAVADENAPIYNMLGVRVNADAKGILIQNGKKFIRK